MENHMERIRYGPQIKAAIIAAVNDARKSGKTWADAFEPAKQAGYKGSPGGLVQLVTASKPAKKTVAPKKVVSETKAPATATATKAKPKQKQKAKRVVAAPSVKAPIVSAPSSSSLDIAALVHKTVTDAVVNALESLLANLKSGK